MEVVDDMKLGKLVKEGGYRSGVAIAVEMARVRWQEGFRNIVRGTTKNFFASASFRVRTVLAQIALIFLLSVLPVVGLFATSGWTRLLVAVACAVPIIMQASSAWTARLSPLYGLTHAAGAAIFAYMIVRSTVVTLRRGGVDWRGTFYPLRDLRKGLA